MIPRPDLGIVMLPLKHTFDVFGFPTVTKKYTYALPYHLRDHLPEYVAWQFAYFANTLVRLSKFDKNWRHLQISLRKWEHQHRVPPTAPTQIANLAAMLPASSPAAAQFAQQCAQSLRKIRKNLQVPRWDKSPTLFYRQIQPPLRPELADDFMAFE